jgi:hypothetical protein
MHHQRQLTSAGLPWLDSEVLDTIFDCVYGITREVRANRPLLSEPVISDLLDVLKAMQAYNARWRGEALVDLLPVLEDALGAMEPNSEGTTQWLALALALQDLYSIRNQTLGDLLKGTTVRK